MRNAFIIFAFALAACDGAVALQGPEGPPGPNEAGGGWVCEGIPIDADVQEIATFAVCLVEVQ